MAGRGEAGDEFPGIGSNHLAVERVDLAGYRLGFDGPLTLTSQPSAMLQHSRETARSR